MGDENQHIVAGCMAFLEVMRRLEFQRHGDTRVRSFQEYSVADKSVLMISIRAAIKASDSVRTQSKMD